MSEFARLIVSLDMLLTGHSEKDCRHTFSRKDGDWSSAAFWMWDRPDIYYLSDGGYSRLATSLENYCIFLCMGATQSVQDRWHDPDVRLIRGRIDQLLRAEVKVQEEKEKG